MSDQRSRISSVCDKLIEYLLYTIFFFISSSKSVLEVFATLAILIWFFKKFFEVKERVLAKVSGYRPSRPGIKPVLAFLFLSVVTVFMVYVTIVVSLAAASKHLRTGLNLLAPSVFIPIAIVSAVLLFLFFITVSSILNSVRLGANLKYASIAYLFVSIITAGLTTTNLTISAGTLIFKTMEYFLLFLVITDVINTRERMVKSALAFIFPTFVIGLDGIYQYLTGFDFFRRFPLFELTKVTATFQFPNSAGTYFATVIPLPLALVVFNAVDKKRKLILTSVLLVALACLLLTQARAAWLGFLFSLVFFCMFGGRKACFTILVVLLILVVAVALFAPPALKDQIGSLIGLSKDQSSQDRLIIWKTAWRMFSDRPLFGHGLGTFMNVFERYKPSAYGEIVYAHNCLLQIAAETGLTGVVVSLWLAAGLFAAGLKKFFRERDIFVKAASIGFMGGLLAILVNSLLDTTLYSLPLAVLFWSVAGLSVTKVQ